ncbi:hypothetical protein H0H87_007247 [Tephrocybe sp. NHM501043]|nr:hypothetical protein H0H87_007247 [Tephrocybe sp. NHM501043]
MTRTRIESLLASFPKLIPANTQHTSVETADVRYVYQPLEDLYILLITNKASNILQDIDTLHLFARVVSDLCRSADEREISKNAFELLGAFDEIVSMGYRESVNLMQVRSVLEMESHEEKIQEIIARNKEAEAKEELKRRAKQLEMQRREQQRRAAGSGGGSSYLGGGTSGYSPVPRFDAPEAPAPVTRVASTPSTRAPAFKGSGMKLGGKKTKQAELIDALGGDVLASSIASADVSAPPTPSSASQPSAVQKPSGRGSLPEIVTESVHISIKEQISLSLLRDGGVESMELKGDMNLHISDAALAHLRIALSSPSTDFGGNSLQFKQHPNVAKFAPGQARVVALKDPSRAFPVGQSLAVLKWRYAGTDESNVPLSINCWPSPSNDGTCEVSIEYELENENVTLYDVVISIPLPAGSYPTVSSHTGEWSLDPGSHSLAWSVARVSAEDDTRSGSMIFTVGGDDASAFFPVQVSFIGQGSLAGVGVASIGKIGGGEDPAFSVDAVVSTEEYLVASSATITSVPLSKRLDLSSLRHLVHRDVARAKALRARGEALLNLGSRQEPQEALNTGVAYTTTIGVGTPPTTYDLLIDTGSSNTWIGAKKEYVVTSSSVKTADSVATGVNYDGILGIGPVGLTKGTLHPSVNDTVPTVTDTAFEQGIIASNQIGVYFEPYSNTSEQIGALSYGGVDDSKFTGNITFAPLTTTQPASAYWGVNQTITYGSEEILKESAGIVDTGSTLVLIATDAFKAYQSATGAVLDSNTGLLSITPAQFDNLKSLFFTIAGKNFELTPNAQLWPRVLNSAIGGTADALYLIVSDIGTNSGSGLDFINGYTFLERYYTVYDTENQQVGFATTAHTFSTTN